MTSEDQALRSLPTRGWLKEYVTYASSTTDAHVSYHIACGLCLLSQSIPISLVIPSTRTIGNFYAMLVGESTEARKTFVIETATKVMQVAMPDRIMPYPGSEQRFVDSLVETPQQILFLSEGGPFFSSMENGYLRVLKDRLTQIYDGTRIARDTVTKGKAGRKVQDNPRLSVLIGISPAYLEGHTSDEDWMSGMLARFYTITAKRERTWALPESDPREERRLGELLAEYIQTAARMDSTISEVPLCLGFDPDAKTLWSKWMETVAPVREKAGRTVKATFSRGYQMAQKIALLLAWDLGYARTGQPWSITVECLAPAIAMAEIHIASAIEIGRTLSSDRDMRILRRVREAIEVDRFTPISKVFREAQVTNRIGEEMIRSLLTQRIIEVGDCGDQERGYRRVDRSNGASGPQVPAPAAAPVADSGAPVSIESILFG